MAEAGDSAAASADREAGTFFISRAGTDAVFADLVGRILEDAGHRVILQQWDLTNRSFMERIDTALASDARVVALLSADYLNSKYCKSEWQGALVGDPLNERSRLILLRVDECAPAGLLAALAWWDLVPMRDNAEMIGDLIRAAVRPGRHMPNASPLGVYWRAPRPIVHTEIRHTSSFTGRSSELDAIAAALAAGATAAVTQPAAVHGLGGIGKSVLAREYARQYQERYAGVWWLNAERPPLTAGFDGIESGLVELGSLFIRDLDQVRDREASAHRALRFLADGGFAKPWLLIYDNVDDAVVLRAWAPVGNTELLLTTRISGWSSDIRPIEIKEWPLDEAVRYLRHESGRSDLTDADATAIAETLGCLPLALSHAAAYLRTRQNIGAQRYLAGLTERMRTAPRDAEYGRAVFATFQQALDSAAAEAPAARAVLSLAAFFAPDAIPEELFFWVNMDDADQAAMEDAIGALNNLSLIDFDHSRRTFSVHRLVQAAARDDLGSESVAWADAAVATLHDAFPTEAEDPRSWPTCERFVSHVRAVATQPVSENGELALLLVNAALYLKDRAPLDDVLALFRRGEKIFRNLIAEDSSNFHWQENLAITYWGIGDAQFALGQVPAAHQSYVAASVIFDCLASSHPRESNSLHYISISRGKIGDVLRKQERLDEALESYKSSFAILKHFAKKEAYNPRWQRDRAVSHSKIGNTLAQQRNLRQAFRRHCTALKIRQCLAAANTENPTWQRDLAVSHNRVGDMLSLQCNIDAAIAHYRAALTIFESLCAAEPGNTEWQHDLAASLRRVGGTLEALGKKIEALAVDERGLAIMQRLTDFAPDHAEFARTQAWFEDRISELGG